MSEKIEQELLSIFPQLYFDAQPIFQMKADSQKVIGYELLLRSTERNRFLLSFFQQVIKYKKLHTRLLQWYRNEIFSLLHPNEETKISLNIHPQQLSYPETFLMLADLAPYHDRILIEITEDDTEPSIACDPKSFLMNKINQIKKMRFSVALDDVGTGIHSLTNIAPMLDKIDVIKFSPISLRVLSQKEIFFLIDFWRNIASNRKIQFIVEGVETSDIHEYLLEEEIFLQQGFYLDKPAPADQLKRKK